MKDYALDFTLYKYLFILPKWTKGVLETIDSIGIGKADFWLEIHHLSALLLLLFVLSSLPYYQRKPQEITQQCVCVCVCNTIAKLYI